MSDDVLEFKPRLRRGRPPKSWDLGEVDVGSPASLAAAFERIARAVSSGALSYKNADSAIKALRAAAESSRDEREKGELVELQALKDDLEEVIARAHGAGRGHMEAAEADPGHTEPHQGG